MCEDRNPNPDPWARSRKFHSQPIGYRSGKSLTQQHQDDTDPTVEIRYSEAMKSTRNTMKLVAMAACLSLPAFSGEYQGGDDSEFGEIEEITYRKSNLEPWKISIGADIHYYDNIRSIDLLAPTLAGVLSDEDDFVYRAGLSVEYTPLITENLFLDTSLTQDFYRFDKLNQLDFDYTAADLGLIYVMQGLRDLQLFARYRFEYLESGTFAGKLYSNHAAELGAQHVYRFAPGQSLFGEMKARNVAT